MSASGEKNRLLLFVVGDEVNSRQARLNLERIVQAHGLHSVDIQEVDVLKNFQEAIKYKVFITPALVVFGNDTNTTIYGNLGDESKVLAALRNTVMSNA